MLIFICILSSFCFRDTDSEELVFVYVMRETERRSKVLALEGFSVGMYSGRTVDVVCIVLGMGLPTTAAYVIAASILVPALVKLGLAMLTAHLFVFYFACLSAITPPVALAAYAGAGIAKCSPMTTAVEACKVGFAGFIVPFVFCYTPAFMMQGSSIEVLYVFATALLGTIAMSMGFQGWYFKNLNILERLLLLAGGLGLVLPDTPTNIVGVGVMVGMFLYAKAYNKKKVAA